VEGNSVSYFNISLMLEKPMADLGAVHVNKYAEALMNAISRRFSEATDVNIIFTCFLMTPIGKTYYSAVTRRGLPVATPEPLVEQSTRYRRLLAHHRQSPTE
jgi:hypothetical protein